MTAAIIVPIRVVLRVGGRQAFYTRNVYLCVNALCVDVLSQERINAGKWGKSEYPHFYRWGN